jgi:hypothetical protein
MCVPLPNDVWFYVAATHDRRSSAMGDAVGMVKASMSLRLMARLWLPAMQFVNAIVPKFGIADVSPHSPLSRSAGRDNRAVTQSSSGSR